MLLEKHMLKSYQQLTNYQMLNYEFRIIKAVLNVSYGMFGVQPRPHTPVDACESSEQPLPLASEKGRSRFSAVWFEFPGLLIVFLQL